MSINADASATKGPEIGSDEWVAQKLQAVSHQVDDTDDGSDTSQDDTSDATTTEAAPFGDPTSTATPSWREAVIPENDDTVPQHFRGKRTSDVWDSYRNLERQWNEDRTRMRELEAKVAAKETFKELLAEQRAATATPPTPSDEYRARGIDLETDPVLNPTKFFPQQEQLILERARALVADELSKRDAAAVQQQAEAAKVNRMAAALGAIEKQRGLTEAQMKQRIPSIMMTAAETLGPDALADSDALLRIHDSIFGAPVAPVAFTATPAAPNPPGVKRPAAVEPTPKNAGPQLKSYEREIMGGLAEEIENRGIKIDPDRLAARYAANLKRQRG